MSEITAFKYENLIRKALHLKQRTEFGGVPLSDYETMKTEDVERKYQQQKK